MAASTIRCVDSKSFPYPHTQEEHKQYEKHGAKQQLNFLPHNSTLMLLKLKFFLLQTERRFSVPKCPLMLLDKQNQLLKDELLGKAIFEVVPVKNFNFPKS